MATTTDNLQKQARTATRKAKSAVSKVQSDATPSLMRISGDAWEGFEQRLAAIDQTARQARTASVKASKKVVAYTKKKPIRALAIAAASGALLHAVLGIFRPSRSKQTAARKL